MGPCTSTYSRIRSSPSPPCRNLPHVHCRSAAAGRRPCLEAAWCTCSGSLNPLTSSEQAHSLQRSGRQNVNCPIFKSKEVIFLLFCCHYSFHVCIYVHVSQTHEVEMSVVTGYYCKQAASELRHTSDVDINGLLCIFIQTYKVFFEGTCWAVLFLLPLVSNSSHLFYYFNPCWTLMNKVNFIVGKQKQWKESHAKK